MDDDFRYRVNYSENIAPKYPHRSQEGLEVVPSESPLYAVPPDVLPPAPLPTVGNDKWESNPREWAWADTPISAVTAPGAPPQEEKRRVLGLTVPMFWTVVVIIAVVLAAAIGGGIGGGLKAQQKSNSNTSRSVSTYPTYQTTALRVQVTKLSTVMRRIRHNRQRRHRQDQEGPQHLRKTEHQHQHLIQRFPPTVAARKSKGRLILLMQ